jgi:hypothetical protein
MVHAADVIKRRAALAWLFFWKDRKACMKIEYLSFSGEDNRGKKFGRLILD